MNEYKSNPEPLYYKARDKFIKYEDGRIGLMRALLDIQAVLRSERDKHQPRSNEYIKYNAAFLLIERALGRHNQMNSLVHEAAAIVQR